MQLSKLIIDPRVRSAWAAIDLGTLLARQFWWRGICLYLILAIPVFLLARFTKDFSSWLPFLIFWWLKPLFERPFLFSLSRELFGDASSFLGTLSNYRQWLWPSLIAVLTIRRISLNRGMFAPISLLERPSVSAYNKRTSILGRDFSNASTWLTIVLYHFETFIIVAALTLFVFLFPDHVSDAQNWFIKLSNDNIYIELSFVLIMAAVAPFYCAAGFMLYICRRITLEGWDIEICFRDWISNYSQTQNSKLDIIETADVVKHD